jgi:catechol 2,3-dioxygenase-like lactoylglutathione lyase family enzyme
MNGGLHHLELWVPDLDRTVASWGWLLEQLGWQPYQDWPAGRSWRLADTYLVFEQSPAMTDSSHERLRPGLNHLAFHVANRGGVDRLAIDALDHGWQLMFTDRHPYAGGPDHYAAYLEDIDGFEAEIVSAD